MKEMAYSSDVHISALVKCEDCVPSKNQQPLGLR